MLDRILVPLDGSLLAECALSHVIAVARAYNAEVMLLRVLGQDRSYDATPACDPLNWQITRVEAKLYLEGIAAKFQAVGVQTQVSILEGLVPDGITEFARSHGINLIILSTHGYSGLSQWGMSSVVQKVISNAPASLLIVRARQPRASELTEQRYQRLLVPLDGSQRAEYGLPTIMHLACACQAQIRLVHVVKKPEMARQLPPTPEDIDLSNRLVVRNQEEGAHYLDQLTSHLRLEGVDVQTHLLTNENPAAALHAFVEQHRVDMVMLGAHGYSGNTEWPYGSLVNNFISYSKVPLLIVQDNPPIEFETAADVVVRERVGY